jgi:hypothetical protein
VRGTRTGEVLHLLDVRARGERALAAGDDDRADGGVRLGGDDGGVELGEERAAERVERLGPVELDERDGRVRPRAQDVLVARPRRRRVEARMRV